MVIPINHADGTYESLRQAFTWGKKALNDRSFPCVSIIGRVASKAKMSRSSHLGK